MLKPPTADTASVPSTPQPRAARAKAGQKPRRVATAPCRAATTASPPASQPAMSASMPGVDAFGRVVDWTLFGTTARNERQAHQIDRANRAQASEVTQQQAELKAQLARSQSEHRTSGLARIQAQRDASAHGTGDDRCGTGTGPPDSPGAPRCERQGYGKPWPTTQAGAARQRAANENSVRGHAAPDEERHGVTSEDEPHVEGTGGWRQRPVASPQASQSSARLAWPEGDASRLQPCRRFLPLRRMARAAASRLTRHRAIALILMPCAIVYQSFGSVSLA